MLVAKFGGTSVQNAEAINRLVNIIKSKHGKIVVVVSAFSKVTDGLLNIINELKNSNPENALGLLNTI